MNRFFSLATLLSLSLFFSCAPEIEPLPPIQDETSSSSANESVKYCVYPEVQQCIPTSQTKCPAGGELSDFCPPFLKSSSSSLAETKSSSSSSQINQTRPSSSDAAPEYRYCVFDEDEICLSGPLTSCPPGGELSNKCPYSSSSSTPSSSSVHSSSSVVPSSSSNNVLLNSFKMAAIIYDTDNSVNPSFNGTYTAPSTANNGIRRGIVSPTLDPETKKPTFVAANGYANWRDAESFNAAFTPKGVYNGKISNIPRCYDMPFGRTANGTWEFDSDKLRTPTGNNLVGGFYPYVLDSAYSKDSDGSDADYTDCPACRKEYTAACFSSMNLTQLNNLEPVIWRGETYTGLEAFDRTYFPDGTSHQVYYNTNYGCSAPSPGYENITKSRANLSFCFESHAQFVYEKGQEFFFKGDDDSWVFINNRLVIDLGGIHRPAPGYVDLDTISTPVPLKAGEKYPIDIFVCERMGNQSNVRISTNISLTQTAEQKGTCGE
jgi:fibro-slime domain-containing protein